MDDSCIDIRVFVACSSGDWCVAWKAMPSGWASRSVRAKIERKEIEGPMAKKIGRRGGRRGKKSLSVVSTVELRAELQRRQGQVDRLASRHRELSDELSQIEAELSALGISSGGRGRGRRVLAGGRKRPRNDSNLEQALAKVLKGKTMGVTEVAEAVQVAGYRTTSPNFRTIVNQTLIRSDLIKKVSRGQYTAA